MNGFTRLAVAVIGLATLLTGPVSAAEPTVGGMPCSEFAKKMTAKLDRCIAETPASMRPMMLVIMDPLRQVMTQVNDTISAEPNGPHVELVCQSFAAGSEEIIQSMNLDAPGCD